MTTTLAQMRLKIGGGAALLALLMAALLLASQPAEAQQVVTTGTLETGKTNRCVLEQASSDAPNCIVTVPGTGVITVSAPNPSGGQNHLSWVPWINQSANTVMFQASYIGTVSENLLRVGKATWTIRRTPASGQPVDYTIEIEVYANGGVPGGKTKGFSKDNTAPTNTAPAAVPAPTLTGALVSGQKARCLDAANEQRRRLRKPLYGHGARQRHDCGDGTGAEQRLDHPEWHSDNELEDGAVHCFRGRE